MIGVAAAPLARRSRQRAALEARTEGALTDATQLAERLAGLDAGSARAVAAQYASDLVALGAELASLIAQSSDEQRKGALDQPRAQVVALHRIVDSVALSAEPPSDAVIDQLREQATRLHTVTAQARAEVFPTPPTA